MLSSQALNWTVFALYMIATYAVGLYMSRKEETATDFFLAGRTLPWYAVGLSLFATNISSGSLVGLAGDAYRVGFAVGTLEWGAILTLGLLAFVYLPYYQRRSVVTMPEFLELRYNLPLRVIFAIVILIFDLWIIMPFVLYTGGLVIDVMFDIPFTWAVVGVAIATGIYTTWGGLCAVVWTDVLQAIFIIIGGLIVTYFGLREVGGWEELMTKAQDKMHVVLPWDHPEYPFPATMIGGYFLISIYYWCHNQTIVQRTLGARSEWDGRMGAILACFIKLFLPFILVVPGIIASVLFPNLDSADKALPTLVRTVVPAGLGGLIVSSVFAALMSTASSCINSWGTIFANDIYGRLFKAKATNKQLILTGRLAGIFYLAIGVIRTLSLKETSSILQFLLDGLAYISAPIIVIFAVGVLWRGATSTSAIVAIVTSPIICYLVQNMRRIFGFGFEQTSAVYWLPIAAALIAILMCIVSLFTPRKSPEELKGLIWARADTLGFGAELMTRRDLDGPAAIALPHSMSLWRDHRLLGAIAFLLMCLIIWLFR